MATLSNLRTADIWNDGMGFGMFVQRGDDTGFSGAWDAWVIVHSGSGHFCATRVGD